MGKKLIIESSIYMNARDTLSFSFCFYQKLSHFSTCDLPSLHPVVSSHTRILTHSLTHTNTLTAKNTHSHAHMQA